MSDLSAPKGFKITEAGMIPNDWSAALARDILAINRGRVISHRDLAQHPGPYPVYSSQTKDNGVMGFLNTFDFEGDYLTWTTDGANAGTVFFRTGKFNCTNVCGAGRARNPAETSAQFYAYFLNTVAWKHVSHVGNPKLMSGPFGSIPVIVPPLHEQQAIAAALSDADGVVAGLERVIAKKRLIKQGAMQDLLTARRRLPGFSGEWDTIRLCDVGGFKSGSGFPLNSQGKTSGEFPFFKVSDFSNQGNERTLNRANHYIDEEDRQRIGARVFPAGTIAFAKIGAAIFLERKRLVDQESCLDNNMAGYILQDGRISRDLVLANLQQFSLGSLVASTALPAIGSGELNSISFPMPSSFHEQQAIAAVLSDMVAEIQTLESRLTKARAIKEGMMQNLLTGRVRLV